MDNMIIPPAGAYDAALREKHLNALRYPESREMYDRTLCMCLERKDGVKGGDQDMIFDLCSAEDIKIELNQDIQARGVMVETRNGRQTFRKENPALARLGRYLEIQRKIRADLKITPLKRGGADTDDDQDDADEFEKL